MFNVSHLALKMLAALVWYSGFGVLYFKSINLLLRAEMLKPGQYWIWLAVISGLIIGVIKAKYLYKRLCIKNLIRINALHQAKLWQFYRLRFFIFLLSMILLGSYFSRQIHDNYSMLIFMATLEISIATALLGSSHCFWNKLQGANDDKA